ncbi:hypothetical protein MXB_3632 [Myxobolus squamalis]|nr:hypothetical protein MXB_3632 [Myxobolus squamalis]
MAANQYLIGDSQKSHSKCSDNIFWIILTTPSVSYIDVQKSHHRMQCKFISDDICFKAEMVYEVELEDEINKYLQPMNELILCFISSEKYFHSIKEDEYFKEAERVLNIIKSRNITGFINFLVRFTPRCFNGICNEFYQRYGYTVMNYIKKYITEDDIVTMFELLQWIRYDNGKVQAVVRRI